MSSTDGKKRVDNDVYPTPRPLAKAFLQMVEVRPMDLFLEPCRGCGAISDQVPLPEAQKSWAEIRDGVDYLNTPFPMQDLIITNPPYLLAAEFIEKALSERAPGGLVAMFLRLNFIGSIERVDFWKQIGYPGKLPTAVPRPSFDGKGSDSCEYAWFCWGNLSRVHAPMGVSTFLWEKPGSKKVQQLLGKAA